MSDFVASLLDAERVVLGELLRQGATSGGATASLRARHFPNAFHRNVFLVIEGLQRIDPVVDVRAVVTALGPLVADPAASSYLFDIWKTFHSAGEVLDAVERLQDQSCRWLLLDVARHLSALAEETRQVAGDTVADDPPAAEHALFLGVRLRSLLAALGEAAS